MIKYYFCVINNLDIFFYILQYPVHNTLQLTEKEATKSYITSFFRSRYERVYDSPPSLVMEVDETTVDPTDSGVHRSPSLTPPTQHSSPAASQAPEEHASRAAPYPHLRARRQP